MIPDSFIQELKYRTDIEQVISGYVRLKRRGRNLTGLCPFHSEKSPSFTVYPENQSFYCFGCGAGGDAITFIRKIENLDYVEAIKLLAQRAGLTVPDDGEDNRAAKLRARVLEMNRAAARYFYSQLNSPAGNVGLSYLRGRGLSDNTIKGFGLGYAPPGWDGLRDHLREKGYSEEEMLAASLVIRGKKGGCYDMFRHRVIFPIIDLKGSVVGFGGRALEDSGPKYLNSPDTPVFKKSRNLFALNFAKATKRQELILCEGYMDVIAVHQGGFDNAVATLGTALTAEQARLISQYTKEVVVAYDSDDPGQRAAKRAIGLFDQLGVKVRVLVVQGAKDPDEYLKKFGPQRFDILLSQSANATEYGLRAIQQRYDLSEADGQVGFLREATVFLAGIQNPIERDVYASRLATQVGVEKQAILLQVEAEQKRRARVQEKKEARELRIYSPGGVRENDPDRSRNLAYALAEEKLITLLVRNPDCYSRVIARISPEDFVTAVNRTIFQAVSSRLEAGLEVDLLSLSGQLEDGAIARLAGLINAPEAQAITPDQADDYIDAILRHGQVKADKEVAQMDDSQWAQYIAAMKARKS